MVTINFLLLLDKVFLLCFIMHKSGLGLVVRFAVLIDILAKKMGSFHVSSL
jgi:hypothetical protein